MTSGVGSKRKLPLDAAVAPDNIHTLMRWPLEHVELLSAHIGLDSLTQRLSHGVAVSTSYSGMGAPEMSMRVLMQVLQERGCFDGLPAPVGFIFCEACDMKPSAQHILKDIMGLDSERLGGQAFQG